MKRSVIVLGIVLLVAGLYVYFQKRQRPSAPAPSSLPLPVETIEPTPIPVVSPTPQQSVKKKTVDQSPMAPPPVQIHKELIPKNIDVVRVYYTNQLMAPDATAEFDINGSGFTAEFKKMITVESGSDFVTIKNLELITPNQIHGALVVAKNAPTKTAFPRILIQGKVVFQAPEPFAVIRSGEVLTVFLTDMGENGRTGRIRAFTNLTEEMYKNFSIYVTTPSVIVRNMTPTLPFVVDAVIDTSDSAGGGSYDLVTTLNKKIIFERKGFVNIVRPNVGDSGLVQQVRPLDGFHRPGDKADFVVLGSGFNPDQIGLLKASVTEMAVATSSLTFVAPGRLDLKLDIPLSAKPAAYDMVLTHGTTVLLNVPKSFIVVDKNWTRGFKLASALVAGGAATLELHGRDLEKAFVEALKTEVDDENLKIGAFVWISSEKAEAPIEAGSAVVPGDYLIKLTSEGKPVNPHFGNVIRINK